MIQQLALTDAVGLPFTDIMHDWVLGPIGMTNSTVRIPVAGGSRAADGASP